MSATHTFLKVMRKLHLYIGIFITPALMFFAFTGALQTFSFHETTQGSNYKPPTWAVKLGQLHKKQTLDVPLRKARPTAEVSRPDKPGEAAPTRTPDLSAPKPKTHLPMKIFFLVVSSGLFLSTLTGLYMTYRYSRNKLVLTSLLVAGIIVPLLLLGS